MAELLERQESPVRPPRESGFSVAEGASRYVVPNSGRRHCIGAPTSTWNRRDDLDDL
ncbi:hypothetical protein MCOR07_011719, partial [Pyricularia oryzae]